MTPPAHQATTTDARGDWQTLRSLAPYLWPPGEPQLRLRVVLALVFLVAAKGANVLVPIFFGRAVDALTGVGPGGAGTAATSTVSLVVVAPVALVSFYGLARLLSLAFGELRDALFARVAQRAIRAVALKTFRHLHRLSLRFHLDRRTGGLSRAIGRGTKGIEFLLSFMLFNVLPTLLELILVTAILWSLFDWTFAVATFGTIALYIVWTLVVTEWRLKYRRQMNDNDSTANSKAIDSLLNYETVKYFANEQHEAERYDHALRAYENAAIKSRVSLNLLNVGQTAIVSLGLVMVMLMAANGVAEGSMTVGDFVLVNTYLMQLFLPLNFLGFVYREIKHSLADLEMMFQLLRQDQEIADAPDALPLQVAGGEIVFEDVGFGYDSRRMILKGVSFRVPPGGKTAIVGPTGAGKSTISRLLYRFYEVDGGRITIDGQDIRAVTQDSLRAAIGIVPQDTVLFNDTIRYNIRYGRPSASDDEVEKAARLAHIHRFIEALPDGYEAQVGERGLKLSGGEKQRTAIARTVLKDPRILLLDEATSALDSHTEKDIQRSLDEVSANRTTLIIAHRLSTVVDADEIIVLDSGCIVERGSHSELLARGERYAAMWAKQQETAKAMETLGI